MSSASKTYASHQELGLNHNGVRTPYQSKGAISPSAPGSPHHIANDGGYIRSLKNQKGWRVQCSQVGKCGGFEVSVGHHNHKTIFPGMVDQVDFTIEEQAILKVEHIGMLGNDWGALVVSRVF